MKLKDLSKLQIAGIFHVNYPKVGDSHKPEDCPGDGPWPCNRKGENR